MYSNGQEELVFEPLKGQIDPAASDYSVGKVKVEIRLVKAVQGRWSTLTGDAPDGEGLHPMIVGSPPTPLATVLSNNAAYASSSTASDGGVRKPSKNWDGITTDILNSEKEKTSQEDPNAGGDNAVNGFFQKIFGDADDETKRAMMKSYSESGGTTLSTNWDEVKKGPVEVKPPEGSEWKKWG